jgi:hypothetical protein
MEEHKYKTLRCVQNSLFNHLQNNVISNYV